MVWAVFSDEHRLAIDEIANSGSQRIIAIVGGAILDDTLRRTLSERLRNDEKINDKLLRVNGPLGNAEPKVDLLWMLGAFEKPVRNALYGLIKVRNFFAHNLDASFDSKDAKMNEARGLLTLHKDRKHYPHHLFNQDSEYQIEPVMTNLGVFIVNLKLCLIALMRDRVSHETWSNVPLPEEKLRERMGLTKP